MDTELIITFSQQKAYWFGLTAGNLISIAAATGTFGILIAALVQWSFSQKAHKQSHKPIIRSDFRMPDDSKNGYVKITNSGLGPALLEEVNIYINGVKIPGKLSDASCFTVLSISRSARTNVEITEVHDFQRGYPVSGNESKPIITFKLPETTAHDRFYKKTVAKRVQFEIYYKDIFGKEYRALDPQPGKEL